MDARLMIGVESTKSGAHAVAVVAGEALVSVRSTTSGGRAEQVAEVLAAVLAAEPEAARARGVTVATDVFEEALAQRRELARVGCLRMVQDASDVLPPLFGWPPDLLAAVGGAAHVIHGGCRYDGAALPAPSEAVLEAVVQVMRRERVRALAITAAFASVDSMAEQVMGARLASRLPGLPIALSHSFGSVGLLDRENTTAINASLLPLAARVTHDLEEVVGRILPGVRPCLTKLDGTVMELPFARAFPAHTLGAVRGSRLRGLTRLAESPDCLVLGAGPGDGGRWLAVLRDGEPTRSARGQRVAGVRTCLPDVELTPVGVGERAWASAIQASGWVDVPRVATVDDLGLPGDAPKKARYAGAMGAASTRVAGEVDRLVPGGARPGGHAVEAAKRLAIERALLTGAQEDTIAVTTVDEHPLAYVPGDLVRLRVVAEGELP